MGEPSYFVYRRRTVSRDGESVALRAGDPISAEEMGRTLRRDVEYGRVVKIEADGTAIGDSLVRARRLGIPCKKGPTRRGGDPVMRRRFETRDADGKITHVEYRQISGPGTVAATSSDAQGGREDSAASDRPSPPDEDPPRRRRTVVDRALGRNRDDDKEPDSEPDTTVEAPPLTTHEDMAEEARSASDTAEVTDDAAGG